MTMKSLHEQEAIGDSQYAQELLNIQSWYNGEIKTLNDNLAKKRAEALTKYQERAKAMSTAEKQAAASRAQTAQASGQKQTGTVDTTGQPVTAQGGTPVQTVESYPDILKINKKSLDEEWVDKYAHIPLNKRNWYQKPEAQLGYDEWKEEQEKAEKSNKKKKMTDKVQNQIWNIEGEIEDLEDDNRFLKEKFESPNFEGAEGEIEQFFAQVGPEGSEILNSGAYSTDEEKALALSSAGVENAEQVLQDYYYYYPEYDSSLDKDRENAEKQIEKNLKEINKLEAKLDELQQMYESINEGTFKSENVDPYELQDLKDYMDAENISYSEDVDTGDIDFDETELDREWRDRMNDMGFEEIFSDEDPDDILSIDDEDDDTEDISDIDKKIDENKVFFVKVEDEDEAFIGKIYKLFDEGDWRSKIIKGDSETFEKLNYDPDWDEFDIIGFLRDNYADADIISEDEFNDHVEEPEDDFEEIEESIKPKHSIPTLDEFANEEKEIKKPIQKSKT